MRETSGGKREPAGVRDRRAAWGGGGGRSLAGEREAPGRGPVDGRFLSLWLNKPKRVGSGWARRHVRGH